MTKVKIDSVKRPGRDNSSHFGHIDGLIVEIGTVENRKNSGNPFRCNLGVPVLNRVLALPLIAVFLMIEPASRVAAIDDEATARPDAAQTTITDQVRLSASDDSVTRVELEFEVYFSGLHVGSTQANIRFSPDDFEFRSYIRTTGLLSTFVNWRGTTLSIGHGERGMNEGFSRTLFVGEDIRARATRFQRGNAELVLAMPPFDQLPARDGGDRPQIPLKPQHTQGVMDPFSAIIDLVRYASDNANACSADNVYALFDGRYRYDAWLEPISIEQVEASDYSFFQGEAQLCALGINPIAGQRIPDPNYPRQRKEDRQILLGRIASDLPTIPVRIRIKSRFGSAIAHLVAARINGREYGTFSESIIDDELLAMQSSMEEVMVLKQYANVGSASN